MKATSTTGPCCKTPVTSSELSKNPQTPRTTKRILLQKTCLALPEPGGNKYRLVKTAGINCICQGSMEALREPTAVVAAEMDEMMEDPEATKEGTLKTGWPEVERDLAPSAVCIPAGRCLQKSIKKLDELVKRFLGIPAAQLSTLQSQLHVLIGDCLLY